MNKPIHVTHTRKIKVGPCRIDMRANVVALPKGIDTYHCLFWIDVGNEDTISKTITTSTDNESLNELVNDTINEFLTQFSNWEVVGV